MKFGHDCLVADILAKAGEVIPLTLVVADGDTTKYPQAKVYDRIGSVVPLATINLSHIASGYYFNSYTVPGASKYTVVYIVYSDAGRTTVDARYQYSQDTILADVPATLLQDLAEAQLNIAYEDDTLTFRALAWMDRAGQTITTPLSCTITVRNRTHVLLYTATTAVHTNGVFAFQTAPLSLADNDVGYVIVAVTDALGTATTDQSFATVA